MADGKVTKTITFHGNGTKSGSVNADMRKTDIGTDQNGHKPRGSKDWQNFSQSD